MTVGNFTELLGTDGFDSIRGEDLEVIYALDDRDHLNTSFSSPGENPTNILVGGAGDNNYIVWNNATAFILENSNSTNILWTTIGNSDGISLEDSNSFVAEIDNRHLYLGNTQSNQYIVVIDWQLPENQIETFSLGEGDLSYSEFVDSFRSSSNYRGNLTWTELNESGEIDLDRLGLSPDAIDDDFSTISARSLELSSGDNNNGDSFEFGDQSSFDEEILGTDASDNLTGTDGNDSIDGGAGDDFIVGSGGDDLILGGAGNDSIAGGGRDEFLFSVGGSDTLAGGLGDDLYLVSLTAGNGTVISDEEGEANGVVVFADNSDLEVFVNIFLTNTTLTDEEALNILQDPNIWRDSFIELSNPQQGIVGIAKSETDLIIDINRDGVAEAENDLTIANYFDEQGNIGAGAPLVLNNLTDREQEVVDFFSEEQSSSNIPAGNTGTNVSGTTVYRFFNNDTGVHFYTANEVERDAVEDLSNFNSEGASYEGVDPLTGGALPVYRFLNEDTGVHLYTISEVERDATENLDNFSFEGEAFFAYDSEVEGSIPIYRFFNSTTGAHFYTPNAAERDNVEDNLPDFQSEGIAYYALPFETGTEL